LDDGLESFVPRGSLWEFGALPGTKNSAPCGSSPGVLMPETSPIDSASDLLHVLAKLQLLDSAELSELTREHSRDGVHALARHLVQSGLLTPYQVNRVCQGRGAELLLGQYLLLERLGEGGMGQVFKARHRLLKRLAALKVIRPELLSHPQAVRRFHQEIQAVARLAHPNIVTAYDAEQAENRHFL